MLLYEYKVRDEFTRIRELANRIREHFEAGTSSEDLVRDAEYLKVAYGQLRRILPEAVKDGGFERHVSFAIYWLKEGKPQSCKSDFNDICQRDLPALEKRFQDWCASKEHYDQELSRKVSDLLVEQQLDSAVRKAFVILKERLVTTFKLSADLDGSDLVNRIFGNKGAIVGKLEEPQRESLRNMLDGIYGVFRNKYGHRDIEAEWFEAEAALSMINWTLKWLDVYAEEHRSAAS